MMQPMMWAAASRMAAGVLSLVLVLLLAVAGALPAMAQWPQQQAAYAADSTIQVGDVRIAARVYHDHGRERREMTMAGVQQVIILRPDRRMAYMIMPLMRTGFEMDLAAVGVPNAEQFMQGLQPEAVGHETVAGLQTTKYRIAGTDPQGGTVDGHAWVTEDGIVVRFEARSTVQGSTQTVRMSLENIQRGPQDAALFEPPAGVNLMRMDPATLRQMQQMPQGN